MQHRHAASICSMGTLMDMQLRYACSCCMSTRVLAVYTQHWKCSMETHGYAWTCMDIEHGQFGHAWPCSMNLHTAWACRIDIPGHAACTVHATCTYIQFREITSWQCMTWVRWSQCTQKPPEPDVCFHYWRVHRMCTNREQQTFCLTLHRFRKICRAVAGCTILNIASRTAAWDATEVHHLMAGCSFYTPDVEFANTKHNGCSILTSVAPCSCSIFLWFLLLKSVQLIFYILELVEVYTRRRMELSSSDSSRRRVPTSTFWSLSESSHFLLKCRRNDWKIKDHPKAFWLKGPNRFCKYLLKLESPDLDLTGLIIL